MHRRPLKYCIAKAQSPIQSRRYKKLGSLGKDEHFIFHKLGQEVIEPDASWQIPPGNN